MSTISLAQAIANRKKEEENFNSSREKQEEEIDEEVDEETESDDDDEEEMSEEDKQIAKEIATINASAFTTSPIVVSPPVCQPSPQVSTIQQNMIEIQELCKMERKKQGLTQREVAYKSGMSQGTITRVENGGGTSVWAIMKVVQALGKKLTLTQ